MLRGIWTSKSAMMAQQEKLDSISNNLANVNTMGYKRQDVGFKDLLQETMNRNGIPLDKDEKTKIVGTGVRATSWTRDNSQGNFKMTYKSTDLAIDGQGYFRITMPDKTTAYTRGLNFNVDSKGNISANNGCTLDIQYNFNVIDGKAYDANGNEMGIELNDEGTPRFSDSNFTVTKDGGVFVKLPNKDVVRVGEISVYNPIGDKSLISKGNNIFVPANNEVQIEKVSDSNILQGYEELSNVDIAKEMTELIFTQRAFDLGSKTLKTADDMWGMVNNLRGK